MVFNYPQSPIIEQIDDYHGTKVSDPYRLLENPDSEVTQTWIKEQNKLTFDYLKKIPAREEINKRLTQLWDYEKFGIPFQQGGRYFYFKNNGLQNQSVLYTLENLDETPDILLDPNTFSEDGTIALAGVEVSENGEYLAYGLSTGGSDWVEWKVIRIDTKEELKDHIQWVKFSGVAWTHDNQGFYYSRYDEPKEESKLEAVNYFQKLYYHRLGTNQQEDILVYHRPDQKEWGFNADISEDGNYLIITVWRGTEPKNLVFYQDLRKPDSQVVELISEFEASYSFVGNDDSLFWFLTDLDSPKGKLIAIDINQPEKSAWKEILPEADEPIKGVSILNNQFVAIYLQDAQSQVKVFDLNGNFLHNIVLPGIGSVGGFNGKRYDTETFYVFTSFTTPSTIYKYDLVSQTSTIFRQPQVDFNPDDYETRQVFYESKDGTKIPMFITYKKRINLDGNNPTYLYGYGGFNISMTPSFSVSNLVWMERGGIYAVANLRGGGEYGEAWHQAGMKGNKHNVFNDFIAAAEWLISNQYTSQNKLAIAGGSNGGLLVGACMTIRPDLFAVALPAVGVMDMLRFHKFTIGWAWCSEYGDPENEEDFQTLYSYSPLHNLKPGTSYPATLITTADHDDRVVPAHSFKFAAALQAAHEGHNPVLIRIETQAGHGAGKPTTKLIEEISDRLAFLTDNLS